MPGAEPEQPDSPSSPPPFAVLDPLNSTIADSFPSPRFQEKPEPESTSPIVDGSSLASTSDQPVRTTHATSRGRRPTSSQQAPRHKSNTSTCTTRSSTRFQEDFGIGIDLPTRPRPTSSCSGTGRSAITSSLAGKERRSSGAKYASTLSRLAGSGEWTIGTCELGTTSREYKVDLSMATLRGQGSGGFASPPLEEGTADVWGRTVDALPNQLISTPNLHRLRSTSKVTESADLPSLTPTARRHRRSLKWVFIVFGIIATFALLSTALVCGLLRRPRVVVVRGQMRSTGPA